MDREKSLKLFVHVLAVLCLTRTATFADEQPERIKLWLRPQAWQRDVDGPILSLGESGKFDDTHIFAPAVIRENDGYLMWYCGSRGAVNERVFRLGLATSASARARTNRSPSSISSTNVIPMASAGNASSDLVPMTRS